MQFSKESKFNIKNLIRKPLFVNADDKVDDIFRTMQKEKYSMAIVKSENKTVGLITLEDAIEEVLGNISDEYN